jgi:hypothetical protein
MALAEVVEPTERVTTAARTWPEKARALRIESADHYIAAGEMLRGIKDLRAEVDATFDTIIASANKTHKDACAKKRDAETPLIDAERAIKAEMVAYDDAQARIARQRQIELEAAERKRIEDDRIALAAHMETEGHEFGDDALVAEAHELIDQPIVTNVAPVQKATPVVQGQSFTTTWSARVTDLPALIKFVAANPSHAALLTPNLTALNAQARSLREGMRIPGVTAVANRGVSVRR